jgi:hypothetical protein
MWTKPSVIDALRKASEAADHMGFYYAGSDNHLSQIWANLRDDLFRAINSLTDPAKSKPD